MKQPNQCDGEEIEGQTMKGGPGHGPKRIRRVLRVGRLYRKELRETMRDRRTVITLVLMPLLLYPILSMALNRFLLSSSGDVETGYTVCVATPSESDALLRLLSDPRSQPPSEIVESRGGEIADFRLGLSRAEDAELAVEANEADVGAKITVAPNGMNVITLYAHRGDAASETARQILAERLQWFKLAEANLVLQAAVPRYRSPIDVLVQDVGTPKQSNLLATLVPLVLVLMTITGAVYPAIDLTAGERERGTLEAVMASPVSRFSVLVSKYFAVMTVAFLTAVANLFAMFTTLWASGLLALFQEEASPPIWMVLPMLALLVLFSSFFSAVLLALTSYARSFKEAQAYLIPVMLLSLGPAMVSLVPGIGLDGLMAVVPLINIVLLARDLLSGSIDLGSASIAIVSTLSYAAAALAIASKLFGGDAVMRTSSQTALSLLKRPRRRSDHPSHSSAVLLLALLVPFYFIVSNGLMQFLRNFGDVVSVQVQLGLNALGLVLTFGMLPLLATIWERCKIQTTYRISGFNVLALLGSAFLGLGCWAIAHEAFVIADALGIGGLSETQIENAQSMIVKMQQAPVILLLLVFAVCPAVIEELCFRGYLFSAFTKQLQPWRLIVITSLLFGLFHVLTGSTLLVERFIPSTLMGLVIGWVAYRTGSVLPGMLIHLVHNGLLNLVLHYSEELSFLGEGFDDQTHLPVAWLAACLFLIFAGTLLVHFGTRLRGEDDLVSVSEQLGSNSGDPELL